MSKRHLPPDHPVVARATLTLGRILDNRGKYDEAIPTLEEAMRLESGPKGVPSDLSATLSELANTHYYLGHYDISKDLNERALRMDEQIYGDRNPNVAQDLTNLADISTSGAITQTPSVSSERRLASCSPGMGRIILKRPTT